jgi:protein SCO1/2
MRFLLRLSCVLLLLGLMSCQRPAPLSLNLIGTDLSATTLGGDFSLSDQHGVRRSLPDFRGKVVALFFGYTHCPDFCPTTLLEYSSVIKKLGSQADKLQVVFITVDPQRDTTSVLASYMPHFDPGFIGLSGSTADVARVMQSYKVVAQKVALPGGGYSVDHSAGSYLLDREGRARVYEPYGTPVSSLVHDIRQLLD